MSDITQTIVKHTTTTKVYLLALRYGDTFWGGTVCQTMNDAEAHARSAIGDSATAYRIIEIDGLPIEVTKGEV